MDSDVDFRWSSDVCHARSIAEHLAAFDSGLLASVVPGGFESYARLLHPAEDVGHGGRLVRWADVAVWSGAELVPGTQFHEIATPEEEPKGPAPWRSQGPREGTLCASDAAAAVEVLQEHTTTPEHCWFCLWDGYGCENRPAIAGLYSTWVTAHGSSSNLCSSRGEADATRSCSLDVKTANGPAPRPQHPSTRRTREFTNEQPSLDHNRIAVQGPVDGDHGQCVR